MVIEGVTDQLNHTLIKKKEFNFRYKLTLEYGHSGDQPNCFKYICIDQGRKFQKKKNRKFVHGGTSNCMDLTNLSTAM